MFIHDGIVVSEHDSKTSRHSSPSRSPSEIESESPCEGDLLMIRRMLGTIPKPLDDTQRENNFHSRYLITNKLCSLIIESPRDWLFLPLLLVMNMLCICSKETSFPRLKYRYIICPISLQKNDQGENKCSSTCFSNVLILT